MSEFWNQRYAVDEYVFGTEPNAFLASQASRFSPGQRVLAVADGEGRNGVWLARQGLDVLAVDVSPPAIAKAEKLAAQHGVTLQTELADLLGWEWGENRFDVVVAIFIQFVGPAERTLIHQSMRRTLKPGGLLILQGYTPKQLEYRTGGPSQVENLYTAADLRREFAGMEFLHLVESEREISEGAGHSGMSALVEMVARKI
ncbi:MAG: class I SAM-dependent methyltransferase [Sulfuricella sp.]|nr:class I SAM-dependent methyltransferase [Sulfuricella sp.]